MRTTRRLATRLPVLLAGTALPVLLIAGSASAHVTVHADEATQGGYAKLTFRVPNETDNADTTKLQVFFPESAPLASVSVQPHPGWSYRVKTAKLTKPVSSESGQITEAVSEVVWTADSKATSIQPGQFDEFNISAGPLPNAPTMVFKALQTYSDGTIVRWIDPTPAGGPEPEHPAPALTLAAAGGGDATTPATTSSASSGGSGTATTALVLSILALVVALGAAGTGLVRRTRS